MAKDGHSVTFSRIISIELKKGTKREKIEDIAKKHGFTPKSTKYMIFQVKHPVITQLWLITYALVFMVLFVLFFAFYYKVDFMSPLFRTYLKFVLIIYLGVIFLMLSSTVFTEKIITQ